MEDKERSESEEKAAEMVEKTIEMAQEELETAAGRNIPLVLRDIERQRSLEPDARPEMVMRIDISIRHETSYSAAIKIEGVSWKKQITYKDDDFEEREFDANQPELPFMPKKVKVGTNGVEVEIGAGEPAWPEPEGVTPLYLRQLAANRALAQKTALEQNKQIFVLMPDGLTWWVFNGQEFPKQWKKTECTTHEMRRTIQARLDEEMETSSRFIVNGLGQMTCTDLYLPTFKEWVDRREVADPDNTVFNCWYCEPFTKERKGFW